MRARNRYTLQGADHAYDHATDALSGYFLAIGADHVYTCPRLNTATDAVETPWPRVVQDVSVVSSCEPAWQRSVLYAQ